MSCFQCGFSVDVRKVLDPYKQDFYAKTTEQAAINQQKITGDWNKGRYKFTVEKVP